MTDTTSSDKSARTSDPVSDNGHNHADNCAQPELHVRYDGHGTISSPGRLDPDEAARITRRITSYAVIVGIILTTLKFFIWEHSHSVGILSSLVHSGLDLLAALATFFGVRYAARKPDNVHSYGRGKAEGIVAVIQACLVLFSASHIAEEAIERMSADAHGIHGGGAVIGAMLFAIALTLLLLIAQTYAIRSTGSVAIQGDRAHYLSDMAATIAVIIGVALTSFTSFAQADAIVALLISLWLIYTAYRVGRMAFNQLMDRELPDNEREYIRSLAAQDPQILKIKNLRSRASGPHVHIQMHADLDANMSLMQAHAIIDAAEQRVLAAFPAADVTIHPDPAGHDHGNSRFRS